MSTPAIAHFGTTIIEAAPPAGVAQADVPLDGVLGDTLDFLKVLGFEPGIMNLYEGIGRQFIWRRGEPTDVEYVEQDNFTSYVAEARPATAGPRVGDTIFRLTHADPLRALDTLQERNLVTLDQPEKLSSFRDGEQAWLLLTAPNGQRYEFGRTQKSRADNHCVYIWTASDRLAAVRQSFVEHFDLSPTNTTDFHGLAKVARLTRAHPGVTIGLLHEPTTGTLAPRWTEDIFKEAGYAHYRMAAANKAQTCAYARQAFADAGDVSFVHFEDSYLELIQA